MHTVADCMGGVDFFGQVIVLGWDLVFGLGWDGLGCVWSIDWVGSFGFGQLIGLGRIGMGWVGLGWVLG